MLQTLATGSLWITLISPLVVAALWDVRPKQAKRLLLPAGLVYLDLACMLAAHFGPFAQLDWNWQGKMLEALWVIILALLPGFSLARLGIRARLEPGSALPVALATLLMVSLPMLMWLQGWRMSPDRETLLFELTMPGLAEELAFRGALQSLLNEIFGRPWHFAGASLGWGAVITAVLFALTHGFLFDHQLHLQMSLAGAAFALIPAVILGWMRERSGSVWPGMMAHNLADSLPLIASLIW